MSSELRHRWTQAGGTIPDGWKIVTLESLLRDSKSIAVGVMYPGPDTIGGVPLIKVGDIKGGQIPQKPTYCISQETNNEHRRTQLVGDELLITLVGNPGECVVVTPAMAGWNPARAIAVIRLSDPELRVYLKTVLESSAGKHLIDAVLNTTVQKTLNLKDVRQLPIPIPPRESIRSLSAFSEALGDRIALLRETNATLEAIAQALFKSWFVDFDPVHANAGSQAPSLPPEIQALFPATFTDSPQGLIPEGWTLVPFGELLTHTVGGDWGDEQPTEKNDVRVAIIRGTDLPDLANGHSGRVPVRFTNQKKLATRKLQDGDLVLEVSGGSKDQPTGRSLYLTNGILAQFDCPMEPASFCRLLRPATQDKGVMLAQHMTYIYAQGKTWEYQNQSTGISNFQTTHFLGSELVVVPSDEVLKVFAENVRPMIDRAHLTQISKLTAIRDTLLPRLISGQLHLPEAEQAIAAITD